MSKLIKNSIIIFMIIVAICIIECIAIWVKFNIFQIENGNHKIATYEEKYMLETILDNYIDNLAYARENYKNFSKAFNMKSHIPTKELENIIDIYELEYYTFEITILDAIKLSDNQFRIKYSLKNTTEALSDGSDGIDVKTGEVKEEVEYVNEIIIDVNKEKKAYKVLYNKFDLGKGEYYEK